MQSWPIIQPSIIIKGRTKRAIYILDLVIILITKLILFLQATVTAIIYSAAFLTIRSRIRPTKIIKTVPFAIISLILSTINLE
jgi:hypothetical protein